MSDTGYIDGLILLQPTSRVTRIFNFPPAPSDEGAGAIPHGTNINSDGAAVTGYDTDGNDVTSELIEGLPSVSSNKVSVILTYPATTGEGRYKLSFALTLDNSDVENYDFPGVKAKDV